MRVSFEEIRQEYLQKKLEGMDYLEIRKELRQNGLEEESITSIIRWIDDEILAGVNTSAKKLELNTTKLIGAFLFGGGFIITIGTYTGFIDLGNYFIVSYGPIITGATLLIVPARKRKGTFERGQRKRSIKDYRHHSR